MANARDAYTVQNFAQDLIAAFQRAGNNTQSRLEQMREPYRRFLARPDLLQARHVPRQGNHVEESRILYYDGEICIQLDKMAKRPSPVHDHGNDRGNFLWETLGVWSGKLQHAVYQRKDDGSVEGYADLQVVEDRAMDPGDIVVVGPPADIHAFNAVSDEVWFVTVIEGHYPDERHYYQPDQKKMIRTTPREIAAGV